MQIQLSNAEFHFGGVDALVQGPGTFPQLILTGIQEETWDNYYIVGNGGMNKF